MRTQASNGRDRRHSHGFGRVARLDRAVNPYGPCPSALEAASGAEKDQTGRLSRQLRQCLSEIHRLPVNSIWLMPGVCAGMSQIISATDDPLVVFPPGAPVWSVARHRPRREQLYIARGIGRQSLLEPEISSDIPINSVAIIDSPSDPLGTLLAPVDAVRLARASKLLVADERFAEFSGQSLLPLSLEFENIIILRSFEVWAGLADVPCAWAVCRPEVARAVGLDAMRQCPGAVEASLATLDNLSAVRSTLRLVQDERSRLYRLLRKFSFIQPAPSWGPFVAARVLAGSRDGMIAALKEYGIEVHAPGAPGLEQYIRFGIGTRTEMERLRAALLELAPRLVA